MLFLSPLPDMAELNPSRINPKGSRGAKTQVYLRTCLILFLSPLPGMAELRP